MKWLALVFVFRFAITNEYGQTRWSQPYQSWTACQQARQAFETDRDQTANHLARFGATVEDVESSQCIGLTEEPKP